MHRCNNTTIICLTERRYNCPIQYLYRNINEIERECIWMWISSFTFRNESLAFKTSCHECAGVKAGIKVRPDLGWHSFDWSDLLPLGFHSSAWSKSSSVAASAHCTWCHDPDKTTYTENAKFQDSLTPFHFPVPALNPCFSPHLPLSSLQSRARTFWKKLFICNTVVSNTCDRSVLIYIFFLLTLMIASEMMG